MIINVFKLDDASEEPLCTFSNGNHVLGRGSTLQCQDKRVSRKHLELHVSDIEASLIAKHDSNPCFFRCANTKHISILKQNNQVSLNSEDTFGFFPDQFWFRVKIIPHSENQCDNANGILEEFNETLPLREEIASTSISHSPNTPGNENNAAESTAEPELPNVNEAVEELNETLPLPENPTPSTSNTSEHSSIQIKQEPLSQSDVDTNAVNPTPSTSNTSEHSSIQIKQEPLSQSDVDTNAVKVKIEPDSNAVKVEIDPDANAVRVKTELGTNSESTPQRRDRCWYGSECYRRNADHRAQFSHPGDIDFESDNDDSRPSCSYGAGCYRRNTHHRKEYKHPKDAHKRKLSRPPGNMQPRKRPRNKQKTDDSPADDYDYSDPFLDDSSEEYELEDGEDSGYE